LFESVIPGKLFFIIVDCSTKLIFFGEIKIIMLIKDAAIILSEHQNKLISEIYDDYSEVILAIKPNFEYPDWSYRPVLELLRHCGWGE